jgi:hypothetical protein
VCKSEILYGTRSSKMCKFVKIFICKEQKKKKKTQSGRCMGSIFSFHFGAEGHLITSVRLVKFCMYIDCAYSYNP